VIEPSVRLVVIDWIVFPADVKTELNGCGSTEAVLVIVDKIPGSALFRASTAAWQVDVGLALVVVALDEVLEEPVVVVAVVAADDEAEDDPVVAAELDADSELVAELDADSELVVELDADAEVVAELDADTEVVALLETDVVDEASDVLDVGLTTGPFRQSMS